MKHIQLTTIVFQKMNRNNDEANKVKTRTWTSARDKTAIVTIITLVNIYIMTSDSRQYIRYKMHPHGHEGRWWLHLDPVKPNPNSVVISSKCNIRDRHKKKRGGGGGRSGQVVLHHQQPAYSVYLTPHLLSQLFHGQIYLKKLIGRPGKTH